MKKVSLILAVLILVSLFAGCADGGVTELISSISLGSMTADQQGTLSALTDPRGTLFYDQTDVHAGFLETCYAEYYAASPDPDDIGHYLQVRPKEVDFFVTLCGKPECRHNDLNCNAYLVHDALGYYRDRIYGISQKELGGGPTVVSMKPDGTDRREEIELPQQVYSNGQIGSSYYYVFHGDVLIIVSLADTSKPLEEQIYKLMLLDLETMEITEPFADFITPQMMLGLAIQPVDSVIYMNIYIRDEDGKVNPWWYALDMDTGEAKELFPEVSEDYTIENGVMYSLCADGSIQEYELSTGQTTNRGKPVEGLTGIRVDGEYVYAFINKPIPDEDVFRNLTLYVLDRDYRVLDELYLGKHVFLLYTDAESIYLSALKHSIYVSLRIDKSKIGTGKLELEPIG